MKKVNISFAHFFCLLVVAFGFAFYGFVTYMAYTHPTVPPMVSELKVEIAALMSMAAMFAIGSSNSSQKKDETMKETATNLVNQLAASSPIVNKAEKVAEEVVNAAPATPSAQP